MSAQQRFTPLRKLLKAFGLSDARIEELIAIIEEWTADDQTVLPVIAPALSYQLLDVQNGAQAQAAWEG